MLVGCDPEFYVLRAGTREILNVELETRPARVEALFGSDHGGWVAEIRPAPAETTADLVKNIARALKATTRGKQLWDTGKYTWRAGAMFEEANNREAIRSVGGHVHLDKIPEYRIEEIQQRLTCLKDWFIRLGWFPAKESQARESRGNMAGDVIRSMDLGYNSELEEELVRLEYRAFPSWLYSVELTVLVLGFSKGAVTKPRTWDKHLTGAASAAKLVSFAKQAWGEQSLASRTLLKREALDTPDLETPLQKVWS